MAVSYIDLQNEAWVYRMRAMKMLTRTTALVAFAWGMSIPLQAEPSPQEIFTQLSAPSQPGSISPEQRAARLPALGYLPVNADLVLAMADAGATSIGLMHLLGENPPEGLIQRLSSIRDAALLAGEGSAAALADALPLLTQASQLEALDRMEQAWSKNAVPAYVDAIHAAFQQQRDNVKQGIMEALNSFHPAPVYYAITAAPGREADFSAMHREMVEQMRSATQRDDSLQYEEIDGYRGLRVTWLHVYKWLMKSEPQDEELRRGLAQRELHLLTIARGDAAVFCLCTNPAEIQLPANPAFSMLYSPKLIGADAHLDDLLATGWISPALNRTIRICMQSNRQPVALAAADALGRIASQDPTHEPVYSKAAGSVMWFVGQPPYFDEVNSALSMQVWQQGDTVYMESVSDAQGMEFGQGELRLVQQAAEPETAFYMESTSFSAPYTPVFAKYWNKCFGAALEIARGIALTLKEEKRSRWDAGVRYVGLFMPEIQAIGTSVDTMADGLAAPFALLAVREQEKTPLAMAFCAAVKNRMALTQGWQELLSAVGEAAAKMGIPPIAVEEMPLVTRQLGNGAVSHELALPFPLPLHMPGVALSDSRFVLGNSAKLNERLVAASTGHMPFCGAVSMVDMQHIAQATHGVKWQGCLSHLPEILDRLAQKVKRLYSVSTINGGVRTARGMLQPVTK